MAAKSTYLSGKLLEHVLRGIAYTPPGSLYVALYTVTPGVSGGGTEVSGVSYARQAMAFAPQSGGSIANAGDVVFPAAGGGGWGTAVGWAILDAPSGGNLLYFSPLTVPAVINAGDQRKFVAGALVITET